MDVEGIRRVKRFNHSMRCYINIAANHLPIKYGHGCHTKRSIEKINRKRGYVMD